MKTNATALTLVALLAVALTCPPISAGPSDLQSAQVLMSQKAFDQAVPLLKKVTEAEPDNSEAWQSLGDALSAEIQDASLISKLSLSKRSLTAYERAATLNPKSLAAHTALVQFHSQAPSIVGGRREKAYAHAHALAELDVWQGNFWLMRLALGDNRSDEAFAACDRILTAEPHRYRGLYQLGRTVAVSGEQLDRGVAALRQALALTPDKTDPSHAHAHLRLGQILEKQNQSAAAAQAYSAALSLDPTLTEAKTRLAKLQ
ncbi:MAG TPA: tetratricopeptide repeat protein [Opitutaceae bacterium]|nr:tetratricopeptide repeat protein [Opitutaceae bacterium]